MNHSIRILYSIIYLYLRLLPAIGNEAPALESCTHKIVRVKWSSISKKTPIHAFAQRLHEAKYPNQTCDEITSSSKGGNVENEKDDSSEGLKAIPQIFAQYN